MMRKKGMTKVLIGVCTILLAFTAPFTAEGAQNSHKNKDRVNHAVTENDVDLTLKQISSHSWESSGIDCITFNYDNHIENIIIEASTDDSIKFVEFNSVEDKAYAANTVLENGTLTLNQSAHEPSIGHDTEARLFIPKNFSGIVKVVDKGNLRISDLNGAATFDITHNTGIVSFMSVTAQKIKVNSLDSGSGILTMRDVKASVDISVIGRITINGKTVIGGTIKGSDGTWCSTIVMNLLALSDDLDIQNKYGPTAVGFAADASFKIDVTGLNISNAYPGDKFQTTLTTLKGSSGVDPIYSLASDVGTFTLSTIN